MKGFALAAVVLVAACGGNSSQTADAPGGDDDDAAAGDDVDASTTDLPDAPIAMADVDNDGLDDNAEATWARAYRPFVSVDASDGCPLGGFVVRVFPHPADPTLVAIIYDHLFESDCGTFGHTGDDEVFGATIDPTRPAPDGFVAMVAISHQNTPCQRISTCGQCTGLTACDTATVGGAAVPVVFNSKDKHGSYATLAACDPFATCFDGCTLATASDDAPIVNAGEPDAHMIDNLTTEGFITAANGWTKPEVFDYDPWGGSDFGGAGSVAGDLVDEAFLAATCHP